MVDEIENCFGARNNKVESMEKFLDTLVVTQKQFDHNVDNRIIW